MIRAQNLSKIYRLGSEEVKAVNDVSLEIKAGEFAAITGPSGSGKTTLVNLLGCLDNPTSGSLSIDGKEIFGGTPLNETELTEIRRRTFGYIFQKFYLIPTLTVYENVLLPFAFLKNAPGASEVEALLERLGLSQRKNHLPGQISGGEMQRTAVARALVHKPKIILADEPTGNLDSQRTDEISRILKDLNEKDGLTILLVTHNADLAKIAGRRITLKDGRLAP